MSFNLVTKKDFQKTMDKYYIYKDKYNQGQIAKKGEDSKNKTKGLNTIKTPTEIIFNAFLWIYYEKINEQFKIKMELNRTQRQALIDIDLNFEAYITPDDILRIKRNGYQKIQYHKKTIRNHLKKLCNAGLMTGYFHGSKKSISYKLNSKIASIEVLNNFKKSENKRKNASKNTTRKNPAFLGVSKEIMEKVATYKGSTSTKLKKIKEECGELKNTFEVASNLKSILNSVICPTDGFLQGQESAFVPTGTTPQVAAPPPQVKEDENTKIIRKFCIMDKIQLANALKNKKLENYTPLPNSIFSRESLYGNLKRDEFADALISEFFSRYAKLWKDYSVIYFGCWYQAIEIIQRHFTDVFEECNVIYPHKSTQFERFKALCWRMDYAEKWFRKAKNIKILIPNLYFDPQRKEKHLVSFAYTLNKLKEFKVKNSEKGKKYYTTRRELKITKDRRKVREIIQAMYRGELSIKEVISTVNEKYKYFKKELEKLIMEELIKTKK